MSTVCFDDVSRRRQRGQPVRTAGGEIPVLGVPAPPSVFLKSVPTHYHDTKSRACVRERFLSYYGEVKYGDELYYPM